MASKNADVNHKTKADTAQRRCRLCRVQQKISNACDSYCNTCGEYREAPHDYDMETWYTGYSLTTELELIIPINDAHSFGEWASNGDGAHSRICANNAEHKETVACSGGTAPAPKRRFAPPVIPITVKPTDIATAKQLVPKRQPAPYAETKRVSLPSTLTVTQTASAMLVSIK